MRRGPSSCTSSSRRRRSDSALRLLRDERLELLLRHAEPRRDLVRERRRRDAGDELERRALLRVELDLQEREALDGALLLEARGEAEEVRRDEDLRAQRREQRDDHLEDRLALHRVGAAAELVEHGERAGLELLEEVAD